MTTLGDAGRVRAWSRVRQLPMDCPYCSERLEHAPRGWVCRQCHSTVGIELGTQVTEEGVR